MANKQLVETTLEAVQTIDEDWRIWRTQVYADGSTDSRASKRLWTTAEIQQHGIPMVFHPLYDDARYEHDPNEPLIVLHGVSKAAVLASLRAVVKRQRHRRARR